MAKPPLTGQQKQILVFFIFVVLAANVMVFIGALGSAQRHKDKLQAPQEDAKHPAPGPGESPD